MIASMHRCLEVAYLITACEHISYCVQSKTVQQELHEKTRKVTHRVFHTELFPFSYDSSLFHSLTAFTFNMNTNCRRCRGFDDVICDVANTCITVDLMQE